MYFKVVFPVLAVLLAVASASLVGGPVEADASDQDAQDALQFAVAQYNRKSNDAFVRQVSEVISVKKQVVAGMKYIFEVKMGRTGCKKSGVETVCAVHEDPSFAQVTPCKIEVWSRPWLKSIKVVKNTCP